MSIGAAWLSSARAVRCWVKSRNERNPCTQLLLRKEGTLCGLLRITERKVGMTSSPHGLYVQGYTRVTMQGTNRCHPGGGRKWKKPLLSSIYILNLDCMRRESQERAYKID